MQMHSVYRSAAFVAAGVFVALFAALPAAAQKSGAQIYEECVQLYAAGGPEARAFVIQTWRTQIPELANVETIEEICRYLSGGATSAPKPTPPPAPVPAPVAPAPTGTTTPSVPPLSPVPAPEDAPLGPGTVATAIDPRIVGVWESKCLVPDPDSPWAEQHRFTIQPDGTAVHVRKSNEEPNCNATKMTLTNAYRVRTTKGTQIDFTDTESGDTFYDLYAVVGSTLRFGHGFRNTLPYSPTSGDSSATRFATLNNYIEYQKKGEVATPLPPVNDEVPLPPLEPIPDVGSSRSALALDPVSETGATNAATITMRGHAAPGESVTFLVDGTTRGTSTVAPDGSVPVPLGTLAEGTYAIRLRAADGQESPPQTVTVDRTPPLPPSVAPVETAATGGSRRGLVPTRIRLSGTLAAAEVTAGTAIVVTVRSEPITRTVQPTTTTWAFEETYRLDAGDHTVTVVSRDRAGNVSPSSVSPFTVTAVPSAGGLAGARDAIAAFRADADVQRVNQQVVAPAVIAITAVSAGAAVAGAGVNATMLLRYLAAFFTEPFLLLFRKRRKPWGTVYHALAKRPVDLAIIRLVDAATGRVTASRVTDREGRFTFFPDAGTYRITVTHPQYVFPSRYLKGKREDVAFADLYHGESLDIADARASVTVNLPIDPKAEPRDGDMLLRRRVRVRVQTVIAYVGPVLALVSAALSPTPLLIGFVVVHGGLLFLFHRFALARRPKSFGVVRDAATKRPIANAIVRLFDTEYHKLLEAQVTNRRGQYGFLVGPNRFVVRVERQGYAVGESATIDRTKSGGAIVEHFDLEPRGA
ncbi:hypothetical protein HY480_04220 [Candidatus Uhrbacteria bacterium]|nr:hypothetical protein [Candidatus Uhrbacteria bacterium]